MALEKADVVMVTQQSSDGKGEEYVSRRVASRGSREVYQLSRTVISPLMVLAVSSPKSRLSAPAPKLLRIMGHLYRFPVWQFHNGLGLHNSSLCTHILAVPSVCIEITLFVGRLILIS